MGNANFVLRLIKHNRNSFQSSLNHSTRCHVPENINPEYSYLNRNLTMLNSNEYVDSGRETATGLKAEITYKAKERVENRVGKLRKNAVYAVEFVISGSHEHLKEMCDEDREAYFKAGIDYIRERFGDDNFLSAHIHYDERTPHAHVFFSAVAFDEKKQKHKTHFKHFIDGPSELSKFQDDFHSEVARRFKMNPNRKKQRTSHVKLTEFYGLVEKHGSEALKNLDYDDLEQVVSKTFKENAIEAHTEAFSGVLDVMSKIVGKPLNRLGVDDFDMFADALNMMSVQNLMKNAMRARMKRLKDGEIKRERKQKDEHEANVHLAKMKQFSQEWIRNRDMLVQMIENDYEPTNDTEIAFKERLLAVEKAYKDYLEKEKFSDLTKRKISAYLRTPEMNDDFLSVDKKLSKLGYVYYSKNKKGSDIAQFVSGSKVGFDYFCDSQDFSHPKNWVVNLIEKIISFFVGVKIPNPQQFAPKRRERDRKSLVFEM